ncbi:MAG: VWA domain-containing protein [Vicinamibacteria bacterium]|nr:VWA domain-containing protein [Vicinamibacteria bacterium]
MKHSHLGLSVLLLAVTLGENASGQTAKKSPLSFGAELTMVAVPVFVTDKDGKTVAGLTAADFELQDSGKPVPIESFLAVSADKPVGAVGDATAPALRRQFLFLFDLDFSKPVNLERARRAAKQFVLKSLSPSDLAAVGTVSPTGFKALVGFTTDRAQVAAAIESLGLGGAGRERDPLGLVYDAGLGSLFEGTAVDLTDPTDRVRNIAETLRDQAVQLGRADRDRYTRHVEQFLAGFQGLARTLDSIKGRKQIVLFSEGFDSSVLSGASTSAERAQNATNVSEGRLWEVDSEDHFGSAAGQSAMQSLSAILRGADVVIHTIDVKGLGETVNLQSQEGEETPVQGKNSLADLAQGSGGRFVRSANNIEAGLGEVLAANRDFYVLAFAPSGTDRGKPRKLSIKVKPSGLKVSHRATYTLPDPKKPDAGRAAMEAAEIIAKGVTGGSIRLRAYALPYRTRDGAASLSLVAQVPAEALLEAVKRKQIGLQLYGYLVDGAGSVLDYFQATPVLDPAQVGESLRKSGLQVITTFAANSGPLEVRLLVRDPATSTWGALRLPVDVPSFGSPAAAFTSAPMIVDDPFARVALPTTTQRRPNRDIPFRLDDRPITVDADPVLKRGDAREVCVYVRPGSGAPPALQLDLVGTDGRKHPQKADKISVVRDADGFDRVVFFVSPAGVEPGEYAFSVAVGGGPAASSPVRVQ